MNVYADVAARIAAALHAMQAAGDLPADLSLTGMSVEPPRDVAHGDVASNAAMVLAKAARRKPREIADALAARLRADATFARIDVAGPGFLNLTLAASVWHDLVRRIALERADYGRATLGAGTRVNVEYVSANPTGPMHVGHCRGAVFGDALANLLAYAGHAVTREYYINDAGGQVDVLARSAYLRYREALGETIGDIPAGLYPGEYLKPVGALLAREFGTSLVGQPESVWLARVRTRAIEAMLVQIRQDLAALNIEHDVFFSEASLITPGRDEVAEAIADLARRGVIYEGRLEKPKGHDDNEWEDREQTLFRSTAFGDDTDRALKKSGGGYTYFASDVAYHHNKIARGFATLINVFGADHVGYIPRIKAAVAALSDGKVALDVEVVQIVRLMRGGEIVKMGKRLGTFVTLRDVVDEVGRDAVRFMMLYRKNDAALDFDMAKVVEQSKDNPVFYVQMAHARAHSVFRNITDIHRGLTPTAPDLDTADLARLNDAGEVDLMRRLAWYPELIAAAARAREPHRIAFYLYDLAGAFHGQWARGNDSPHLRFIQPDDRGLSTARLALVRAVATVIASGLSVLGVEAPEEMR
jgi:arginyl-tRNA synthetase